MDNSREKLQPDVQATPEYSFGRVLRFWRTTFNMSQEDLSWEVGVSTKHISFLESGRSQPGRATVLRIAEAFDLGLKDTNNLLVSAGFFPQHHGISLDSPALKWLRKSLIVTLQGQDPNPAIVTDPYGNILMVNKAWLRFYRDNSQPGCLDGPLNAYRLYFGEEGLRPYLLNWDILSCGLLMNLQQELLLRPDPDGQAILDELLGYPNIPQNWQRRAAEIAHMPYYTILLRLKDQVTRKYRSISNTVGATPYVSEPRLLLVTYLPTDGVPYSTLDELERDESLLHPLLPY